MRLMFVHYGEPPLRGSERIVIALLKFLSCQGHEVYFLCNQHSLKEVAKQYCIDVEIYQHQPPFGFFENGFSLCQFFIRFCSLTSQAWSLMTRWKPDLVICNSIAPSQWVSHCANFKGVPFLVHLHSSPLPYSRLTSFASSANCILGVSDYVLEGFREDGIGLQRCLKLPNGISVEGTSISKNDARSLLGLPLSGTIVAVIGALVQVKRFDIAIQAAIKANQQLDSGLTLLVVGDGLLMPELCQKYSNYNVRFLGWRTDIAQIICAVDFVLSTSDREAFGLTIIEAASLSRASIVAAAGGQMEIVENGVTGLHFLAGSVIDCTENILKLARTPFLAEKLGENAYIRYLQSYTEDAMTAQFERQCKVAVKENRSDPFPNWGRIRYGLKISLRLIFSRIWVSIRQNIR